MQKGMKRDFNLPSFKILVVYGKWIQSTRAWLIVWLCTIWSLKMKGIIILNHSTNVGQLKHGFIFQTYTENTTNLENSQTYYKFKTNLVEHLWAMKASTSLIEIKLSIIFLIKTLWMHFIFLKLVACEWFLNGYGIYLNCGIYVFWIVCEIWSNCKCMVVMGCVVTIGCISISVRCVHHYEC